MGLDGGEYSLCGKGGVEFGGHVCRVGFLLETPLGNFRARDAIKNGTRQSRAPLRALAGTRAPAKRPVSLEFCFSHHKPLTMHERCSFFSKQSLCSKSPTS